MEECITVHTWGPPLLVDPLTNKGTAFTTGEREARGAVYPPLSRIRDCSHAVACAVIRRASAEGHAAPAMLDGLEDTVSRAMWYPRYRPIRYEPSQRHP